MEGPQDLSNARGWEDVGRLIGSKISRIEELERDNALLRSQLEAELRKHAYISPDEARSATDHVPRRDHSRLVAKYNELHKQYRDLQRRYSRSEQSMQKAYEKYKDVKVRIREWQVYLEKNGLSHRADETARGASGRSPNGGTARVPTDGLPAGDGRDHSAARGLQSHAGTGDTPGEDTTTHLPILGYERPVSDVLSPRALPQLSSSEASRMACAPTPSSPSKRISSSQTTCVDDKTTPDPSIVVGPESDTEPQVVSARPVKRKRAKSSFDMPPPVRIKQESTSQSHPIELASTDYSSPSPTRQGFLRKETSDLDALVEHLNTPRKRRLRRQHGQRAVSEQVDRAAAILSPPPVSWHSLPPCKSKHKQIKAELGVDLAEQDAQQTPLPNARGALLHSAENDGLTGSAALRPLSPNIAAPSRAPRTEREQECSRGLDASARKVSLLAEDGTDPISEPQAKVQHAETRSIAHGRLDALLNGPSPNRTPIAACPTPATGPVARVGREAKISAKSSPKTPAPPRAAPTKPHFRSSDPRRPPTPPRPEDEPLRSRDLNALRLDDFRINAAYLGSNFAFADTLRGRDQRRCLPGCTRPECCGAAFRSAVEMGAVRSDRSDAQVLEAFLGPQWEALLGSCGPAQRKEMLLQAQAFDAARVHGKHRSAFERHSTPPGFWRTDMPTTQEAMEDREQARAMERQKVEERWREALRENGRWRFRDE